MVDEASIWLIESPVTMVEGEQVAFSVDWLGAASVAEPDAWIYKHGTDITVTAMGSGDEHTISGNVLTLKKLTARANDGGSRYVVVIEALVDGNVERRKLLVQVVKAHAEG
jgi:hypothetical protein